MLKNPLSEYKQTGDKLYGIYRGVVENRLDPEKRMRCQIRIFGIHSPNTMTTESDGIPTDTLHWAEPAGSLLEGSVSGFGLWSVPLQGSHVYLFFENGNINQPRYFATASGVPMNSPDTTKGFCDPAGEFPRKDRIGEPDVHRLARGDKLEETILKHKKDNLDKNVKTVDGGTWNEPEPAYKAKYPDNTVFATHSGIIIEVDSTPENPRIHIFHPSNSYVEIDEEGNMVVRNAADKYEIVIKNRRTHVLLDDFETINGNQNQVIVQNQVIEIGGSQKETIQGSVRREVDGTVFERAKGEVTIIGSTVNINP